MSFGDEVTTVIKKILNVVEFFVVFIVEVSIIIFVYQFRYVKRHCKEFCSNYLLLIHRNRFLMRPQITKKKRLKLVPNVAGRCLNNSNSSDKMMKSTRASPTQTIWYNPLINPRYEFKFKSFIDPKCTYNKQYSIICNTSILG